ncbi:OTU domain-containing protein 3 [Phytophthora cinnamomi]|uniref:OTU domain-containing protein 3 n=1 Tax=Phytophthora cinnamomi TaxID=4785 RepID=UPI00355A900E|nr:OTU domain-containing protein 3 [Phytophthora cinnamomi]
MGRKAVKLAKKAPKVIFEAATGKKLDVVAAHAKHRSKTKAKKKKDSSYVVDDDAIKLMRRQLADVGCKLHEVEADGNCLFRALGDQLYGDQHRHEEIRGKIVDYLEQHRDDFEPFMEDEEKFDRYCERMREDGTWGGNQELYAAARLFQVYVVVHQDQPSARIMVIECDRLKPTRFAHVAYHGEDHYDSVRALRDPVDPDALPVSIELSCEGFRPEDLAKQWQSHASSTPGAAGEEQPERRVVPTTPTDSEVDQLAGTLGDQLQVVAGKTLSKRELRQLKKVEKAARSSARHRLSTPK